MDSKSSMKNILAIFAIGLAILTACASSNQNSAPTVGFTPFPEPTATKIKIFPTASAPLDSITWRDLQVTMDRLEITQEYQTDFGSSRIPTEGNKFLWVHVQLKNTAQTQLDVPVAEHFSVLYAATELKPTYGHRADYTDYTTLGPIIFPNQELDGWLRFDIPAAAELKELRFVFLPESSHVGASYNSPNYPYSDDKPTYVWRCAP
jgi:hypothetical protein